MQVRQMLYSRLAAKNGLQEKRTVKIDFMSNERQVEILLDPIKELQPSNTYSDYQLIERGGPFAIYSPQVNAALRKHPLTLENEDVTFAVPSQVADLAEHFVEHRKQEGAIIFNDPKVRLASDLTVASVEAGEPVKLQRTDYFSTLVTNDLTCRRVEVNGKAVYDGREFMSRDGVVRDFADSGCSNHIGACTVAITSDGRLVIPAQSLKAAQYPGMLMPSGSGSVDPGDAESERTLQEFVIAGMERELLEETGLDPFRRDLCETRLLGYARLLERGGKPDFFGISLLNVPFYAVSTHTMTALRLDLPRVSSDPSELPRLLAALAGMREDNRGVISTSLYLNLLLLEDYLEAESESFFAWLASFEQATVGAAGAASDDAIF